MIIVFLPAFFYMSARMLMTQKNWSIRAQQYARKIEELQKEDKLIEQGGDVGGQFQPGIDQVRAELNKLTVDRQRVWYKCDPQVSVNRQTHTATIKVTIDQPNPSGIANKSILYAFEDVPAAQQGRYLGEFKVTAVSDKDKQITLEPAFILTPADLKKLAEAKKPWNLYDSLPHDNHDILEQLSEQDKKAILPADSAEEYIEDGKPAPQGAPAGNIVDGKYVRPLRDYGYLFDAYRMKITELVDREQSAMRDKQMVEDTLADAKLQVQFWQKQGTVVKAILAEMVRQRDAVAAHLDNLQKKIAEAKAAITELIKNNKAMAGQIAKIQLDATRRMMSAPAPWRNLPTGKNKGVGIYDRDYYRRNQPGFSLRMPQSMVMTLILINAALFLIDGLLFERTHDLTRILELSSDTLWRPWMWWQFITYGFVHGSVMHILMNMLQLWFLGAGRGTDLRQQGIPTHLSGDVADWFACLRPGFRGYQCNYASGK